MPIMNKSIVLIIKTNAKEKTCVIYPLKRYGSLTFAYDTCSRKAFNNYLKDFFSHRGKILSYQIVDECQRIK